MSETRPLADEQARELVAKVVTLRSNPHYRVADIYYHRGIRWRDSAVNVIGRRDFDGSVLLSYLLENGYAGEPKPRLLRRLIEEAAERLGYERPTPGEMVIHLRTGDVVVQPWFLSLDPSPEIEAKRPTRVTLVTAFAFQEFPEHDMWMFSEEKLAQNRDRLTAWLRALIQRHPRARFDVFSNSDPDRDMAYMLAADHFVPDRGGFSELISELRLCGLGEG